MLSRRDSYFPILLRLITALVVSGFGVFAADFNLDYNGASPVSLHTELTYEGKGVRLTATAKNDSGSAARVLRICILSPSVKTGCLFEIWNTSPVEKGASLSWNLVSRVKVASLEHDATLEEFEADDLGARITNAGQKLHEEPPSIPPPTIIRWTANESNSDSFFVQGLQVKSLEADGIEVRAAVSEAGGYLRVDLSVVNGTSARIDLLPRKSDLFITKPKPREVAYKTPEQLSNSIRHRATWATILIAIGSARTKTITSNTYESGSIGLSGPGGSASGYYSGSATTYTTVPDESARIEGQAHMAAVAKKESAQLQAVEDIAVRANTLFPGQRITGALFFELEKKHDVVLFTLPLGDHIFQFAFDAVGLN